MTIARTNWRQTFKFNIIKRIITMSTICHEVYGTELLHKEELEKIPYQQLKLVEAELRIRLGLKRRDYDKRL